MPDEFYTNEYRMFNRYFSKWEINKGKISEGKAREPVFQGSADAAVCIREGNSEAVP
jgi:hypothetical protein